MQLLLHTCCAPCLLYPLKFLQSQNFTVTPYFFNPNIHPYTEFKKRLGCFKDFCSKNNIETLYDPDLDLRGFLTKIITSKENRCLVCYTIRLDKTAQLASEKGFDCFSTTLLYSIYQNHSTLKSLCKKLQDKYKVEFLYADFTEGWQEGIDLSIEQELYRQKYCGCIFSEQERFDNRLKKRMRKMLAKNKNVKR